MGEGKTAAGQAAIKRETFWTEYTQIMNLLIESYSAFLFSYFIISLG